MLIYLYLLDILIHPISLFVNDVDNHSQQFATVTYFRNLLQLFATFSNRIYEYALITSCCANVRRPVPEVANIYCYKAYIFL